jgi:hypothetical protein
VKTLYKVTAWIVGVIAVVVLLIIVGAALQKSHQKAVTEKTDELYVALIKGSSDYTQFGSDSFFDGGDTTSVNASYEGTIDTVRREAVKHVEAAGFKMKCPAVNSKLDFNEEAEEIKVGTRDKCSLSGKGVAGTVRFYSRFEIVHLEAVFKF